jgi:DNA-binding NtrC family response regulator
MQSQASILIIDDDPVHLQIYRLVVESAGFRGLPVLVSVRGINLPEDEVHAVLLDYRLAPNISARDIARAVKERYPAAPILILSDMLDAPAETAPYVHAFVPKGNPEMLLGTLRRLTGQRVETVS